MDRVTVQYGQVPLETDMLQAERFALTGLAKLSEATLGTNTVVSGFTLTPTAPSSLSCNLSAGQIYEMENLEATAWSSLGVDTHSVMKQGIALDPQTLTFTPPSTSGYAQYALVQATYVDQDTGGVVRPYYNALNPTQPFSGPGNNGAPDNTQRKGGVSIAIKYGVAVSSGQQVAPTPDPGYAGLFLVSLAYNQTTIGAGQITQFSGAPFIPVTLPGVPAASQSGKWRYGIDTGSASNLSIALNPTPASLTPGMEIIVSVAAAPSGATVANVAGFGNLPVVRRGNAVVAANDWFAGDMLALRLNANGSAWMLGGVVPSDIAAVARTLTASRAYYVNTATGNDSNDGLTTATPLLSPQTALNRIALYNLNGFSVIVYVTGSFGGQISLPSVLGSGTVTLKGNSASPGSCLVQPASGSCFLNGGAGTYIIDGFRVATTSGNGFLAGTGNNWTLQNIDYGPCSLAHISCDNGSIILGGTQSITGSAASHIQAINGGSIRVPSSSYPSLTVANGISFSAAFIAATTVAVTGVIYSSITGAANASGPRYSATTNAVINTLGSGANYYPGSTAGTTNSGGQYV